MRPDSSVIIPQGAADIARALAKASAGRIAYAVVWEGVEQHGREKAGWYLALAVEHEAGYHQLAPGYGPFGFRHEGQAAADELNTQLGHTAKDAVIIVLSSMGRSAR